MRDARSGRVMTRRGWLLFGIVSLLWDVPYMFIRIADRAADRHPAAGRGRSAWRDHRLVAVAALLLAPAAVLDLPTAAPSPDVVRSLAVLGVACTALAFVAFVALIAEAGAARASVITRVLPLVA